jgi:hypothetical protein
MLIAGTTIYQWSISTTVLVRTYSNAIGRLHGIWVTGDALYSGVCNGVLQMHNTTTGLFVRNMLGHDANCIITIRVQGDFVFSGGSVRLILPL